MKFYEMLILFNISIIIVVLFEKIQISNIPKIIKEENEISVFLLTTVFLCSLYNSLIYYYFNKKDNDPSYFYCFDFTIILLESWYKFIFDVIDCVSKIIPNCCITYISKIMDFYYNLCYCDKWKKLLFNVISLLSLLFIKLFWQNNLYNSISIGSFFLL